MPIHVERVLFEGTTSPNAHVSLTDAATGLPLGEGDADGAGVFSVRVQFANLLQALMGGLAGASATLSVPGTTPLQGVAGGLGKVVGAQTQAQPEVGAAGGLASAGAGLTVPGPTSVPLQGAAGGVGGESGAVARQTPLAGAVGGVAGAAATATVTGGAAVSVTENFNDISDWVAVTNLSLPTISGGAIGASQFSIGMRRTESFAANQYAECAVYGGAACPVTSAAGVTVNYMEGPAVRVASAAQTYYMAAMGNWDDGEGGSGFALRLFRCVDGEYTAIGSPAVFEPTTDFVVRIEASGTSITVKTAPTHGGTYTTRITASSESAIGSGVAGYIGYAATNISDFWAGDL